jgi:hypothetical protein
MQTLLHMRVPRRGAAVLAAALALAPAAGCSGAPPTPQATADAYLAAWARQGWAAMQKLTSHPRADFAAVNQAAFRDLTVRQASFTAGVMHAASATASTPVTERLTLAGLGPVTIRSALHLVLAQGRWLVRWSPATIAPPLRTGDQLSLRTAWPARAAVLGARGTPLTGQEQVVTIGVEGVRIKNAAALKSALVAAGAPAAAAADAIAAATAHPTFFEPVFTVSRARYTQLQPAIYPLPGTVFQSGTALTALTPGLAAGVVGTLGPVTAEELGQLGAPYTARDSVGQTGLEQADEQQLAGTPGATVSVVSASGTPVATLATLAPRPGTPVTTTIDPAVQRAAEAAFGGSVPQPRDAADLAATSIGQGRVLVSPLGLAMVAAAADTGTVRAPRLVTSVADGAVAAITGPPGRQLPAPVVSALHEMMASVVARGTAAGQGLPAGTYAKTGTAQYGTAKPLTTDAWLMGFKGDVAFAALLVNSAGNGGPVCGPIVARFLRGG